MPTIINYKVNLVPLRVENRPQAEFRDMLYNIPYLMYEVEVLANGEKIVINKPGGKRNYGKLAKNDFMVFIYNPWNESLWLISHNEISDDISIKHRYNPHHALSVIQALYRVCCGEEPDFVIRDMGLTDSVGIPVEAVLKVYKWIWGQEDCNYPNNEGRWFSMNELLRKFNVTVN